MSAQPTSGVGLFPPGAVDTHLHFYDSSFPVAPSALLRPPDASPDDYAELQRELGLDRLVIVQPTTYGLDNTCQLRALERFGPDARGVVVVDTSVDEQTLRRLTDSGVRGVRFHMLPGGAVGWDMLAEVARRIAPYGWHVQLQLDGHELERRIDLLRALPVETVVDHVGRFMPPDGTDTASFRALVDLLEDGRGWVKLSAPYESSAAGPPWYADVLPLVDELVARVPERLVWATNWPHPGQDHPPTAAELTALLHRWIGDAGIRRRVLVDNPATLYGF